MKKAILIAVLVASTSIVNADDKPRQGTWRGYCYTYMERAADGRSWIADYYLLLTPVFDTGVADQDQADRLGKEALEKALKKRSKGEKYWLGIYAADADWNYCVLSKDDAYVLKDWQQSIKNFKNREIITVDLAPLAPNTASSPPPPPAKTEAPHADERQKVRAAIIVKEVDRRVGDYCAQRNLKCDAVATPTQTKIDKPAAKPNDKPPEPKPCKLQKWKSQATNGYGDTKQAEAKRIAEAHTQWDCKSMGGVVLTGTTCTSKPDRWGDVYWKCTAKYECAKEYKQCGGSRTSAQ